LFGDAKRLFENNIGTKPDMRDVDVIAMRTTIVAKVFWGDARKF